MEAEEYRAHTAVTQPCPSSSVVPARVTTGADCAVATGYVRVTNWNLKSFSSQDAPAV